MDLEDYAPIQEVSLSIPQDVPEYSYLRFPSLSKAPINFKRRRLDRDLSSVLSEQAFEEEIARFEEITRTFLQPFQIMDSTFVGSAFIGFGLIIATLASQSRIPEAVAGVGIFMVLVGGVGFGTVHRYHVMPKVLPQMTAELKDLAKQATSRNPPTRWLVIDGETEIVKETKTGNKTVKKTQYRIVVRYPGDPSNHSKGAAVVQAKSRAQRAPGANI